jgi:phosphatidylserine decarboxylase
MGLFETETRLGSRDFGKWSQKQVPYVIRSFLFGLYSWYYGVVTDDMVKSFSEYNTINSFFTREIKPRFINQDPGVMVSPADSKILSVVPVTKDMVLAVKGVDYSLGQFLYGKDISLSEKDIQELKLNPENELYSVVYYLSPGDYHRYHSHDFWNVNKINHIPGHLAKVKDTAMSETTYTENERVIVFGDSPQGRFYYGIVGATNVGSMDLSFDSSVRTNIIENDQKVFIFIFIIVSFIIQSLKNIQLQLN